MSDEHDKTQEKAASPGAEGEAAKPAPVEERFDEDGLPLHREATLDDVRSDAGSGRVIAIGCSVLVVLFIGAFWAIRAGLLN